MRVCKGNEYYATEEYKAKIEDFANRVAAVDKKRLEILEELNALEHLSWELDVPFFDPYEFGVDTWRTESYNLDNKHESWLASNHNC